MHIIKTDNASGIPNGCEIREFEWKNGFSVNECDRLSVKFKRGKRRKIKRLHIKVTITPCEYCGSHSYATGKVGGKEFEIELS